MGSQRSLQGSLAGGVAGRKHSSNGNKAHVILKGDRISMIKIERDCFHYCLDGGIKVIATAREDLTALEVDLQAAP